LQKIFQKLKKHDFNTSIILKEWLIKTILDEVTILIMIHGCKIKRKNFIESAIFTIIFDEFL